MSTEEEPPTKKAKSETDEWDQHKLNISEAVMKADEGRPFTELATESIRVLQGIGKKADSILDAAMGLETVTDLASYKFYKIARAIQILAATESSGDRPAGSRMNIDNALDKECETKSLTEVLECPVSALQGLTAKADAALQGMGITTIGQLADCKFFAWAQAIVELAEYEETMTKEERKAERLKKQLG